MLHIKSAFTLLLLLLYYFTECSAAAAGVLKDKSIWDILTTDERFSMFIHHIEEQNQTSAFKDVKAGTVFAPTNKAFNVYYDELFKRKITGEQILNHIVPVAVSSNELWNGRLLKTWAFVDQVPQVIKVTETKSGIYVGTGGDQEQSWVSQADIEATNGVIHAIDKLIPLPSYIDATLRANKDTRDFYDKSVTAEIDDNLKYSCGVTVFAVQGDQFGDYLSPVEKRYLSQPEGRDDLAKILKHQIASKIYYSDDFPEGNSTIKTVEGTEDLDVYVENNKGAPSAIQVNGVRVIRSDILAANGVVHVLEKPILPKHKSFFGSSARKSLIGLNCTDFIKLFDKHGLGAYLDDNENDLTTILAPSNEDISPPSSKKEVKSWLKYHLVHGRWDVKDLHDGQLLETETHQDLDEKSYQRIDVHQEGLTKPIRFGRSSVIGDPVYVGDNLIIYHIAQSLVLPRDPLSRLPVNLDLSTFVAALYASGQDSVIAKAHDISLFAPTNDAFSRLGLLARYLLQPEAKDKLTQVASYHAVRGVFYTSEMKEGEHREPTLSSGAEINLNKTKEGLFVRGSGAADGSDRTVIGQVIKSDMLTSSGVIHTIDRVQLPSTLEVTNKNLLSVEGTNSFLRLLERCDLAKDVLEHLDPKKPYTVLAPSDRAFGKDGLSALYDNREALMRVAKLHILPVALPLLDPDEASSPSAAYDTYRAQKPDKEHKGIGYTGTDFPTLLGDNNMVTIRRNVAGGYSVSVKGSLTQEGADVINYGRSTTGGGVIEIDRVLVPKHEYSHRGMAWWEIALIVLGSIVGAVFLAVSLYLGWRWYQARRSGRIQLQSQD